MHYNCLRTQSHIICGWKTTSHDTMAEINSIPSQAQILYTFRLWIGSSSCGCGLFCRCPPSCLLHCVSNNRWIFSSEWEKKPNKLLTLFQLVGISVLNLTSDVAAIGHNFAQPSHCVRMVDFLVWVLCGVVVDKFVVGVKCRLFLWVSFDIFG